MTERDRIILSLSDDELLLFASMGGAFPADAHDRLAASLVSLEGERPGKRMPQPTRKRQTLTCDELCDLTKRTSTRRWLNKLKKDPEAYRAYRERRNLSERIKKGTVRRRKQLRVAA